MKCRADNFIKDCCNQEKCCEVCEVGYENCPESCCEFEKTGSCKGCEFSIIDYSQYYNKGNDCDCCKNQYLCGRDGDMTGCKRQDNGLECEFVEDK